MPGPKTQPNIGPFITEEATDTFVSHSTEKLGEKKVLKVAAHTKIYLSQQRLFLIILNLLNKLDFSISNDSNQNQIYVNLLNLRRCRNLENPFMCGNMEQKLKLF